MRHGVHVDIASPVGRVFLESHVGRHQNTVYDKRTSFRKGGKGASVGCTINQGDLRFLSVMKS